ncbi:TIGR00730 family Rossman fold protein [Geobacillus thermodenitrificans]|uniref:LOG family protein n=1 Tax=Geobacillus thermodenitrificans TaxID=33940 RepID=UPI000410890F|nr:TIGR00730 family Rossman fold protein [Geobacillus thermodenitrificans]ARA97911.1 Rossman fold protein, TIGR00730 family [Geobacillus thermodenitrificans]
MKAICVFCGSSYGQNSKYKEAAQELGMFLARRGITLIYGGGKAGLMGEVAEAVLGHQGHVVGIIPQFLKDREVAHDRLSELVVVDTMHTRKAKMNEAADGFIALPGGYGTYEELFEVLSWSRVGLHQKPIGLLNVDGFFDPLLDLLRHTVQQGFAAPQDLELIVSAGDVPTLYEQMSMFRHRRGQR